MWVGVEVCGRWKGVGGESWDECGRVWGLVAVKIVAKPVRLIAVFDEKGAPTPLRFQIEEEGERRVVKVDQVVSAEAIRPAGMDALVFRCQSGVRDALIQYELIYRVKAHVWELYKM